MPGRRRRTPRPVPATTEEAEAKLKEAASQPANLGGYVAPRGSVHTSVSLRVGDFEVNLSSHRDY